MIFGVVTMLGIIVLADQLIWRPVIAWSNKFKFEQVESTARVRSPILYALQNSKFLIYTREHTLDPLGENVALQFRATLSAQARSSASRGGGAPPAPLS